jgi:hypothetical protein
MSIVFFTQRPYHKACWKSLSAARNGWKSRVCGDLSRSDRDSSLLHPATFDKPYHRYLDKPFLDPVYLECWLFIL